MQASIFLAKLLGPIIVIAVGGMLLNRRSLAAIAGELLRNSALLYLLSLIDVAAGLAIVLNHNVWVADWRVLITLLGWVMVVRGTIRIFFPDQIRAFGEKLLKNDNLITGSLAVSLILGLVLTYFGYAR